MYSVLGLDQSMRRTGWAHFNQGSSRPASGLYELEHWGNEEGKFALKWYRWLLNFCRERNVTHLFWEDTLIKRKWGEQNTAEDLAGKGLVLLADMVAAELGIIGQMVPIGSWRARFLGTARAPPGIKRPEARRAWFKREAMLAAGRLGWFVDNDNIAEALGIMHFGVSTIDPAYASRTDPIFRRAEAMQEKARLS